MWDGNRRRGVLVGTDEGSDDSAERWMNDVLLARLLKTKEVVSRASARGVFVLLTVAEKKPEVFCGYLVGMSDSRGQLVVREGAVFPPAAAVDVVMTDYVSTEEASEVLASSAAWVGGEAREHRAGDGWSVWDGPTVSRGAGCDGAGTGASSTTPRRSGSGGTDTTRKAARTATTTEGAGATPAGATPTPTRKLRTSGHKSRRNGRNNAEYTDPEGVVKEQLGQQQRQGQELSGMAELRDLMKAQMQQQQLQAKSLRI